MIHNYHWYTCYLTSVNRKHESITVQKINLVLLQQVSNRLSHLVAIISQALIGVAVKEVNSQILCKLCRRFLVWHGEHLRGSTELQHSFNVLELRLLLCE